MSNDDYYTTCNTTHAKEGVTMGNTLTRFDPMEHLDTTEDHLELLNDALATGNPRVFVNVISEIARVRGMTELSRTTGLGRSSLYRALADDGNPTIDTVMKVLEGLNLKLSAQNSVAA